MTDNIKQKKKKFTLDQMPLWFRMVLFFAVWLVISYSYVGFRGQEEVENLPYSEFKQRVVAGDVKAIEVQGEKVSGEYRSSGEKGQNQETSDSTTPYQSFVTIIPPLNDQELMQLLEEEDVTVTALPSEDPWFISVLVGLLPWVLLIGFFLYMNKKMRERMGGSGGPFSFGKSKARRITHEDVQVSFDDVAGLENVKTELAEMVEYLKRPESFQRLGAELPKGILLAGPPGTGKTLMARAMAGEAGVPYYSISGSEFIEMFVGVGASRVRDMFKTAKENAPSLIFIDELDSIGRARGTGIGGGHDEREQTLNQILSEIDGFSPQESVIVLAATNRPDVLDPALIRPGRFDRQITLDMPRKEARREILDVHTKKVQLAENVDLAQLAGATVGFSGADLKNLVNEAALLAARKGKEEVEDEDFNESRDKILLGVRREGHLSEEEKKKVAYHEAGHALMALLLPGSDPLNKVTIIPRGRSLGATEQVPEEDRHNYGKAYLLNRIIVMIGGRAAEQAVFDDITSGAGDDLKQATQLAKRMVCQWGMSERVGLVVFRKGEPHPFLGRELTEERDYSEATAELIDAEIKRILDECHERAQQIITDNRDKLDRLAVELLEAETLSLSEIQGFLSIDDERNETGVKN